MATRGFMAAWNGYSNPAAPDTGHARRMTEYALYWSLYENSIFDPALTSVWDRYRTDRRLVEYVRSVDNITPKLVDAWRSMVYPGALTADGASLPDGARTMIELAIPAANSKRGDDLKAAVAQVLRWSNFQQKQADYVLWGAALGETALEVCPLNDRSKVQILPRYPGHIAEYELGDEGNVAYYRLEYRTVDRKREGDKWVEQPYTYAKEVDRDEIRYYRDGSPYDDGNGAAVPNVDGFVPLVWVRHESRGGDRGAPAIAGSIPTFEALNCLLSILLKDAEIVSRSPKVVASTSTLSHAFNEDAEKAMRAAGITLDILKATPDTTVHDLASSLNIEALLNMVEYLAKAVERNHPEASMWERLREMSEVTGPAARRLVGDTLLKVGRISGGYDDGLVRACQMAISMAARRREAWPTKGAAQGVFAPFTVDSYENGELDFSIVPRDLVPEIPVERWEAEAKQAGAAAAWEPLLGNKVLALDRVGISAEALHEAFTRNAEAIRAEQMIEKSDLPGGELPPEQ